MPSYARSRPASRVDVHQHVWTEPLLDALRGRDELPFVRSEQGLTVLYLAGERPYVIDLAAESAAQRRDLLREDGVEKALVCISSPLRIESLPRAHAQPLLDAYHRGALALGGEFGVWGALALGQPRAEDVDRVLALGCVGVSLPAGALAGVDALQRLAPVLERLSERQAPLFVHPGPAGCSRGPEPSLADPLWWPALTQYVAEMQAAWLAFFAAGRRHHPALRVVFAMLAGLAPLHHERLRARGGPALALDDPLVFYESSSYGRHAVELIGERVGAEQLLYGSDRPVVDPRECASAVAETDWQAASAATAAALHGRSPDLAVAVR